MDEESGLDIRNWDFTEQPTSSESMLKPIPNVTMPDGSILNCSSGMSEREAHIMKNRDFSDRNPAISEVDAEASSMEFAGHSWVHQRNFPPAIKASPNSLQAIAINPETIAEEINTGLALPSQALLSGETETKPKKPRKKNLTEVSNGCASKVLKPKQSKKQDSNKKAGSGSIEKHEKKNPDIVIDGTILNLSCIPAPVCSCTGVPRICYRWGCGGWQSSCCTTTLSEYPLPMSSTRPGSRIAGRKMSNGAYAKLLQKLSAEGHDLSIAIDLKNHWAKHGTNKFVTKR